jgi:quercetin dioxygenase-like cupin family protein
MLWGDRMKIVRRDDPDLSEDRRRFTGENVSLVRKVNEQRVGGMRVAVVRFPRGTRTVWHFHHGEQLLYVLSGRGWFEAGTGKHEISAGDIVYVAPGEKHWHGATAVSDLEHLAITVGETEWEEEVADPG